jgi:hypothetical protein
LGGATEAAARPEMSAKVQPAREARNMSAGAVRPNGRRYHQRQSGRPGCVHSRRTSSSGAGGDRIVALEGDARPHRIEQLVNKFKNGCRVATRHDETGEAYLRFVRLASASLWLLVATKPSAPTGKGDYRDRPRPTPCRKGSVEV